MSDDYEIDITSPTDERRVYYNPVTGQTRYGESVIHGSISDIKKTIRAAKYGGTIPHPTVPFPETKSRE